MGVKICPLCGSGFEKRKKGGCPACGEQLEVFHGRAMTPQERERIRKDLGNPDAVWMAFVNNMHRRDSRWMPPPKGSTAWVAERKLVKNLISAAVKFIGYHNRLDDIDSTSFTVRVIDLIFVDPGYASWVHKIQSLQQCNGRVFWGAAPKALKHIDGEEARLRLDRSILPQQEYAILTLG